MQNFLKTILCIIFTACISHHSLFAQNGEDKNVIKGKVTDKKTQQPISGASITELDADNRIVKGTSTDIEGNFVLKITNQKNKISISYIGFKTITQNISGRTTVNFQLEDVTADLGEVIVLSNRKIDNGMMSVSERNSTMSVARISAKDLEEMQAASIDQALQGRLSGVDITASSGDPGAAMNIRIRGTSSISTTGTPLIVVDGMPFETQIPADFNFGAADEQGYAQLINISPADIRDISVLKDGAATAVWGSKAANGVILISTKRGTRSKPSISYTAKTSKTYLPKAIPMLSGDQYSTLIPEAYMNRNGSTLSTQNVREFNYDPSDPYWYNNYSNNTNWVDAISQVGSIQDHNISMNGGGEKAKYFASVGYYDWKGTIVGTGLKRINTRINLDYDISERIKIFTSIAYTHSDQNRNYLSTKDDAIMGVAYIKMPNMSVFEYDEFGNLSPNYFSPASNVQGSYNRVYNPLAMAKEAKYSVLGERVIPRFQVNYELVKKVLRATFDVQFDINNTKNKSFLPQIATGRPSTETVVNRAYDGDIDLFSVTSKIDIAYTPTLKNPNHEFQSYLSMLSTDFKSVNQEIMTSNTASSLITDPASASRTQNEELRAVSFVNQTRSLGAVAIANYAFRDKYILNGSLRMDGSSKFGPNYKYGLFPSASLRWRISGEKFLSKAKKIDDLSLRASYGTAGEAPRYDYTFYNRYSTFGWSYQGQSGVFPSTMELTNLRWQTVKNYDLGTYISLFGGRFRMDADLYMRRTKDLFFDGLQIASYTGYSSVNMNVGTIDNKGWELAVWTTPYKTKDLSLSFDFNISRNENIFREISEYYPSSKGDVTQLGEYLRLLQVNNPFGAFYGYRYKGVYTDKDATIAKGADGKTIIGPNGQAIYMRFNYPSLDYVFQPGDAMYEDINHDGNINYMDVVYLGNSNPKLTGGFGPRMSWKNKLFVSTFFNFRYGFDVINGTKIGTTNMYRFDNQSTATLRRWRKEGDITDMPRAIIAGGYNWLGSDRYVEDASFLRFRTATIRYVFDTKKFNKVKMKTLSAYVTGENLVTFTKYTGQNPDVSASGADPFRLATDNAMTPPSKVFTIGVVAGF